MNSDLTDVIWFTVRFEFCLRAKLGKHGSSSLPTANLKAAEDE